MTTQIIMRKVDGVLRPIDDEGQEIINHLPADAEFFATFRVPRNIRFHRLFFALLNKVVDSVDWLSNSEQALLYLKIATGAVSTMVHKDTGQIFYVPQSIDFAAMDETKFRRFFDRAVYVFTSKWGVDNDLLLDEIDEMLADPRDYKRPTRRRQSVQAQEEAAAEEPQAPAADDVHQMAREVLGVDKPALERDPITGMLLPPKPHDFESYKFAVEMAWENAEPADEQRLIEKWAKEGMPDGLRNTIGLTDDERESLKAYVLKSRARLRKEAERQP